MKKVYETWQSFYADLKDIIIGVWHGYGTFNFPEGYECSYSIWHLEGLNKHGIVWRLGQKEGGELFRFEPTKEEIWVKEPYVDEKAHMSNIMNAIKGIKAPFDEKGEVKKFCVVYGPGPDYLAIATFPFTSCSEAEKKIAKIKKRMSKKT